MNYRHLLILCLILFNLTIQAQTSPSRSELDSIKINEYYWGTTLPEVLENFKTKYHLPLVYDSAFVSQFKFDHYFSNATARSALNTIKKKLPEVNYRIDKNGKIIIEEKTEESLMAANYISGAYKGEPKQFNFTIVGSVRDANSHEPLPYASVVILSSMKGSITNTDGYYTLIKVPSDTCLLQISYIGYKSQKFYLNPELDFRQLDIYLDQASFQLDAVEIKGDREDLLQTNDQISVIKMSPKQLEMLPNLGEKDPMRAFQLMPGISGAKESTAGLYVRGGTPDQNLITYDGFTVYHVDHLYGFYSAFNSNAIKDIQLFKGGYEAKYGSRLSSVMEITGKEGNANYFNMGGEVSLLSANAWVEGPIGKNMTGLFAARRSWQGPLYSTIFEKYNDENELTTSSGPGGDRMMQSNTVTNFFYDMNGKLTYNSDNKKDKYTLSFFNGTDKLDNSRDMSGRFNDDEDNMSMSITDLTRYGNIGGSMAWSRKWTDQLYSKTIASYSHYYSLRDQTQDRSITNDDGESENFSEGLIEDNDLLDYSVKSDWSYKANASNRLEFGAFGSLLDIDYLYSQNDTLTILNRSNQGFFGGLYFQDKIQLFKNKLQIIPGIRSTYYNQTKKIYWAPRLQSSYRFNKHWKMSASWGIFHQYANQVVREDISSGSRDFWILSDGENINVGKSEHYIAGLSWENDNFLINAEGYYKNITGLTEYTLRFQRSFRSSSYDEYFYNGQGYARGIEVLMQKKFGKINGWISYTLGEAQNQFDVYGESYFPSLQDVTHEFKLVGMYKYKRWNFGLTWVYATGSPYTAPMGAYEVNLLDGTTKDYLVAGNKNAFRLPDYHRLDISANYKLISGKGREIGNIGASIFNVYNRTNAWYYEYSLVDDIVYETRQQFLGITPNVSFSFKLR